MAKKQYILSKHGANPIPTNGDSGLWHNLEGTGVLSSVAAVLPDPGPGDITTREDLTVPSPWSELISFDILLGSVVRKAAAEKGAHLDTTSLIDYGEIQKQAETDWRAIMTLIALRKIRGIPITFEKIDLTVQSPFFANIKKQCPTHGIFMDNTSAWNYITLIKLDGDIIGIMTPTNLVCARYYYAEDNGKNAGTKDFVPNAIAWLCNNRLMKADKTYDETGYYNFCDPVDFITKNNKFELQQDSIDYIAAWLESIKITLGDTNFDPEKTGNLIELIDRFKESIEKAAGVNKVLKLAGNVGPDMLSTPLDIVENVQGQYSLIGLITALAFENLAEYEIIYRPIGAGNSESKFFNNGIFNGPAVNAIMLQTHDSNGTVTESICLGAINDRKVITVANNPNASDALKKCGLMTEGGDYINPIEFAMENPKRYVYITKWMQALNNVLMANPNAGEITGAIGTFLANLNASFNAKYPAGTLQAMEVNNYNNNSFVTVNMISAVNVIDIFNNITTVCDFTNTGIAHDITIAGTMQMVFSDNTIGSEMMNYYNKSNSNPKLILTYPKAKEIFKTSNVFNNKVYYVEAFKFDTKRKFEGDWSITKDDKTCKVCYDIIWPINPDILNSLSFDAIIGRLSYSYDAEEDKCILEFRCTLNNPSLASKIRKVYCGPFTPAMADHDIVQSENIPGFTVWPHVKNNGWYSVYKSRRLKTVIGDNRFDAELAGVNINERGDWNLITNAEYERGILYTSNLPRCIDVVDRITKEKMGWILFEDPTVDMDTSTAAHLNMKIGLDFGTSSTTLYYQIDGGAAAPAKVDFSANPVYMPIKHDNDDSNIYYIPQKYNDKNYYPTMLRISSKAPIMNNMMQTGNNVYKYEYKTDAAGVESNVTSDVKWSATDNNQRAYLTQIIMQAIVFAKSKGCTNIEWEVSYPSAFPDAKLNDYQSVIHAIIAQSSINMGVTSIGPNMNTESVSSASFLLSGGSPYMAVIDIGGGSTDISFWSKTGVINSIVQSSIKMASRDIFLNPLKEFICSQEALQDAIAKIPAYSKIKQFVKAYTTAKNSPVAVNDITTLVEQMILNNSDILKKFITGLPPAEPQKVKFETKVTAGFFALVYYTLESIKNYVSDIKLNIDIALVGNGARLYDWIPDISKQKINQYIENWCDKNFAISGLFNELIPVSDATAKTETANGLLYLASGKVAVAHICSPSVMCGIGTKVDYFIAGVPQESIVIGENEDFYSDADTPNMKIIKNCYAGKDGYKATSCSINMNEQCGKLDEFKSELQRILGRKIDDLNTPKIIAGANTVMNTSFATGLIQSPLFSVIMAVINQL